MKDIYDIQIFPAFGYPSTIVSDRDVLFTSDVWQGWCEENGIEQSLSTSYHPETDGQTEIVNKAILQIQRAYALENISWIRATPKIQMALNSRIDSSKKMSPFKALYGFEPKLGSNILPIPGPFYNPNHEERHKQVTFNLNKAKQAQTIQANKLRNPSPVFSPGEEVLLSTKNLNISTTAPKLDPLWYGPFKIETAYPNTDNYKLDFTGHPEFSSIHPVFHTTLLKKYHSNNPEKFPAREFTEPGPVEEDEWEIEQVLEFRFQPRTRKPQYKVRWKGYAPKFDSWVFKEDITTDAIEQYWRYKDTSATYKKRPVRKAKIGRRSRTNTLAEIAKERDSVLANKDLS